MGAANDSTPESPDDPVPTDDLPEGLRGLAIYEAKCEAWRFEYLKENPDADLPDPSDLEGFADDLLTAMFGPVRLSSVPERYRGDPVALHGYARWRKRQRERERKAAILRLVRRAPRPIHKERWKRLGDEILTELDARGQGADSAPWEGWENEPVGLISARLADHPLDEWQIETLIRIGTVTGLNAEQVGAALEAIYAAAMVALASEDLRSEEVKKLENAFRAAFQEAYASDLVGSDWKQRSNPREVRENIEARLRTEAETLGPADLAEVEAWRRVLDAHERRVEARVRELTAAQRPVYRLREGEGSTYEEIAEELGITKAAARNRMKRARRKLGETD